MHNIVGGCAVHRRNTIFTEHVKAAHVIRKVLLRQVAILNYVNPL
jgi:hypothetical protein